VRIENEITKFVEDACVFRRFAHVRTMSELCPKKYKTSRTRFNEYGSYESELRGLAVSDAG
jgi:hypothetical protein